MHAHFHTRVYPMHSHDTYSFGVTESGAQGFYCRREARVSAAGMVMAFNPDDPHDGHTESRLGYRYRMLHVDESLVADVLTDATERDSAPMPLFAEPVVDPSLAGAVRALHDAVVDGDHLAYDEGVRRLVVAMVNRCATSRVPTAVRTTSPRVERARALLLEDLEVSADDLASAAGCSRFALYRGFREAYGLAPSEFRRQLRLRRVRDLIADGRPLAEASAVAGFADQSHLTRCFHHVYGVTPGAYQAAIVAAT